MSLFELLPGSPARGGLASADLMRILQMLRDTSFGRSDPLEAILRMIRGTAPSSRRRLTRMGSGGLSSGSQTVPIPPSDVYDTGP